MRIAVRHVDTTVDADGRVTGHDAGATLVRRLLRLFPDAVLVGPGIRRCAGFDLVPLELLDPADTVVINLDALDSLDVWRTLRTGAVEPQVMTFVWLGADELTHPVERATLALGCALLPTFANSERTAGEVRALVDAWTPPHVAAQARIVWSDLGVRLEHVQPRREPDVPVVLYPAIWLSARKRPEVFLEVVERVHRRVPLRVEMRLHESHLVSETAMALSRRDWVWVGPLTPSRAQYWAALASTTAFLATAADESYGLAYVEALVAGAVGVLPDLPWARALLPAGYPFRYRTTDEAVAMLERAVTDPAGCRAALDACADGDFGAWLRRRHDDGRFEAALVAAVHEWFGPAAGGPPDLSAAGRHG